MATKSQAQLCVVRVHHLDLLLPMDQGMKLVAILQQAVLVERDWVEHSSVYNVRVEDLDVELLLVRSNQVRMPQGEVRPAGSPRTRGIKPLLTQG